MSKQKLDRKIKPTIQTCRGTPIEHRKVLKVKHAKLEGDEIISKVDHP